MGDIYFLLYVVFFKFFTISMLFWSLEKKIDNFKHQHPPPKKPLRSPFKHALKVKFWYKLALT